MKRARFTAAQVKAMACASLNQTVIDQLEGKAPKKKKQVRLPGEDCRQVKWMWAQLSWWGVKENIYVTKEHRFHPVRKWRFDFALPAQKIGIEYEGINSEKSRHTTLNGYTGDAEKYNAAQAAGWRVLRFTAKNYKTFLTDLKKLLNDETFKPRHI